MITGHCQAPQVRQYMLPSSDIIWLNANGKKSANWMKATGRPPAMARPIDR